MAAIHVAALLSHPAVRSAIERALAARGQRGDTMIAHIDPREAAMLRFMGGAGTVNPRTGLRQFYAIGGDGSGGYSRGDVGSGNLGQGAGGGSADALGGGVGGGYGGGPGNQGGSGLGAGGGHSGQNYYSQTYGGQPVYAPAPATSAPVAPISNMPPPTPVSLTPMISSTATTDLTGGRFGALPSWATTPYQIGMAPSSYPTPGVNAALGAPRGGGGAAPGGEWGAGGAAVGGTGGPTNINLGGGLNFTGTPGTGYGGTVNQQGYTFTQPGTLPSEAIQKHNNLLNFAKAMQAAGVPLSSLPWLTNALNMAPVAGVQAAPTATAQAAPAVQAAAQPAATKLNFASQAAPGAIQQLHPAVQQAVLQGLLGGNVMAQPTQTSAQRAAIQRLMGPR